MSDDAKDQGNPIVNAVTSIPQQIAATAYDAAKGAADNAVHSAGHSSGGDTAGHSAGYGSVRESRESRSSSRR